MKKSVVIGTAVGISILVLSYAISRIAPLTPIAPAQATNSTAAKAIAQDPLKSPR